MKKITIINKHLGIGGTEKYLSELTRILSNDYDIDLVISYKIKELPTFPISSKVNISYLVNGFPTYKKIHKYIKRKLYLNVFKEYLNNFKLKTLRLFKTIKILRKIDGDYLIVTRLLDIFLVSKFLKNKNVKTLAVIHENYNGFNKFILFKSMKKIDKLIVPCIEMKEEYESEFEGKVEYISNFIDLNSNVKSNLKNKTLISIGNFSKDKNVLELIDIMNEIIRKDKDINLVLIGDGKDKHKIREKIDDLNLSDNIKLTGNLNKLEIEDYMVNSSVYVSSTLNDSIGLQFLEAMNYGLPVVCYESSNMFVNNEELLIRNNDIDEFANKIIYLFKNKNILRDYSKLSNLKVKDFSLEEITNKWKSVIKGIK